MKHTPGPWKRQGWAVLCKHGTVVCNVLPWDTSECREEDHANTRLIAAAPEMLAVLEALTKGPLSLNELNELMSAAVDVVAKAKGEA